MSIHLILGGARSGKSSFAEQQAKLIEHNIQSPVYYLATAQPLDAEMLARIEQHQKQRPDHWLLTESPIELAKAIEQLILKQSNEHKNDIIILVDCLTLWLTNCLCSSEKNCFQQEKKALLNILSNYAQSREVHLLLVSNEVGHGIVPMGELSRDFVDQAGWLHQEIAAIANRVDFIMAGIPLSLKATPHKYTFSESTTLKPKEHK
jgi:adenosylcobinamide kinase/adenosylcobinamide-phosphate guanylyltransferase